MKKIIPLILVFIVLLSVSPCNNTENKDNTSSKHTNLITQQSVIKILPKNTKPEQTTVEFVNNIYIANKNSKKFHRPNCNTLPLKKNQIEFSNREEAIKKGYSPCKNCLP
ncbi:MAG: Ada metal-binding domain-containing protein [Lachnospirales bacterium]